MLEFPIVVKDIPSKILPVGVYTPHLWESSCRLFPAVKPATSYTRAESIDLLKNLLRAECVKWIKDGVPLPVSQPEPGEEVLIMGITFEIKVRLFQHWRMSDMTKLQMGERMGKPSEIYRILDPMHYTNLETLRLAFKVLGKRVSIGIEDLEK
jgi:hypothetical protein